MGFFDKIKDAFSKKEDQNVYLSGLEKGQQGWGFKLKAFFQGSNQYDQAWFDELIVLLVQSDVSVKTAQKLIKQFRKQLDPALTNEEAYQLFAQVCGQFYGEDYLTPQPVAKQLYTIMMVGVNGSGKTTSSAKLGYQYTQDGKKVLLVAADTFRAAAVEQLKTWGDRISIEVFSGKDKEDPASVLVEASRYALENEFDVMICDTAGRLQNKVNLMSELSKMKRVLVRECGQIDQVYLVLDATTGQNGLSQAKEFKEATDLDAIILTKLDGSSKGGILLSIKDELDLKVAYVGLGEQVDQLRLFDIEAYLYSLLWGNQ